MLLHLHGSSSGALARTIFERRSSAGHCLRSGSSRTNVDQRFYFRAQPATTDVPYEKGEWKRQHWFAFENGMENRLPKAARLSITLIVTGIYGRKKIRSGLPIERLDESEAVCTGHQSRNCGLQGRAGGRKATRYTKKNRFDAEAS